ncbi:MAG: LTA synthase family protein [Myxococcota bacterium]|nr:LTA synthase family protein [Myxococcota bacterium]
MARGSGGLGPLRGAVAGLALVLAPWFWRTVAILESPQGFSVGDLRGYLADAAISLLLLALLLSIARLSRWIAVVFAGVLAVGYGANYETIAALGTVASPLDLGFLGDPTFVAGSALELRHPLLLPVVVLATSALAWVAFREPAWSDALLSLAGAGVAIGGVLSWAPDPAVAAWRQANAVEHNIEWLVLRPGNVEAPGGGFSDPAEAVRAAVPAVSADLAAPLRFGFDGQGKNVLLVVLEGVSGNYLPAAARVHERQSVNTMRNLDRAFSKNVGYATFFNHNRRTNRGLYALLCGEYPRLVAGMPKMTVGATRSWRRCLPEILTDHGYRTLFLQAAPLAFMLKDRFMPAVGFQEVLGHAFFERHSRRTFWGVDDRAFFEQALERLKHLDAEGEPWFATLLTVGSHHPYVVPEAYERPELPDFRNAFAYLDLATGQFLRALEASGLRKDTLVILTSDESAGDLGQVADATAGRLSESWGFMVLLLPERTQLVVTEPFAQSDVALSVLDYLGLSDAGLHLFGRSVFRRYDRGRSIFFGNVNHRTIGGVAPDGSLLLCEFEGHRCRKFAIREGRYFAGELPPIRGGAAFADQVREVARRSVPPSGETPLALPLVTEPVFEVRNPDWQLVQGISQLALEPHEWIEVALEVEATGTGGAELRHELRLSKKRGLIRTQTQIEAGQRLALRYRFASDLPVPQARLQTMARMQGEGAVDLVFRERRFVLRRSGERPPEGVEVEVYELAPPADEAEALGLEVVPVSRWDEFLRGRNAERIGASGG